MKEDWVMIRVPRSLKGQLEGYALTLTEQLDVKQQGNHDDPRDWAPPLWRVIELLLRRDQDHRKRSNTNSERKRPSVTFTNEGGFRDTSEG